MHDQRQQQEGPEGPMQEFRKQVNVLIALAQILSAPVEPWLRRCGTCGERYFGFQLGLGLLVMPLFVLAFPQETPVWLLLFWAATVLVLVLHRIVGAWRRHKGYVAHSRYSGTPLIPGDEITVKSRYEPGLIIVIGIVFCFGAPALGAYLVTAGVSLGLATGWQVEADRAVRRRWQDAMIEQQVHMQHMRKDGDE